MTRDTIDAMLKDVPSWSDPKNDSAKRWFIKAMAGREYGYDPLLSAWTWFLVGWFGGDENCC